MNNDKKEKVHNHNEKEHNINKCYQRNKINCNIKYPN